MIPNLCQNDANINSKMKRKQKEDAAKIEKEIYDQAQERIKSGNYSMAIDALESLERRFPFGRYAEQAQAELIYAYYENRLFDSAVIAAERFISLHPRHPNTCLLYTSPSPRDS